MTRFPPDFEFSQSSLTDAAECLRRFQLRHMLRQEWPAPLIEPLRDAENEARLGEQFHHMAERYYLGLPVLPPGDERLRGWFDALRQTEAVLNLPKTIRQPEATYSVALSTRRLNGSRRPLSVCGFAPVAFRYRQPDPSSRIRPEEQTSRQELSSG
jgi:hypothetical protein